jgi:hypothetical protein
MAEFKMNAPEVNSVQRVAWNARILRAAVISTGVACLITSSCMGAAQRSWADHEVTIISETLRHGRTILGMTEPTLVHPQAIRVDPEAGPAPGDAAEHYHDTASPAIAKAVSSVPGYALCTLIERGYCAPGATGDIEFIILSEVTFADAAHASMWLVAIEPGPEGYYLRYFRVHAEGSGSTWRIMSFWEAGSEG